MTFWSINAVYVLHNSRNSRRRERKGKDKPHLGNSKSRVRTRTRSSMREHERNFTPRFQPRVSIRGHLIRERLHRTANAMRDFVRSCLARTTSPALPLPPSPRHYERSSMNDKRTQRNYARNSLNLTFLLRAHGPCVLPRGNELYWLERFIVTSDLARLRPASCRAGEMP